MPVIEQIAAALLAVLQSVTVANGYAIEFSEVVRPSRLGGYKPAHLLCLLMGHEWRMDEANSPMGVVRRIAPFSATIILRPSDADATAIDTYRNVAMSAAEQALVADRRLGGLAQDLKILEPLTLDPEDGSYTGVVVQFEVAYRHAHDDPHTAA